MDIQKTLWIVFLAFLLLGCASTSSQKRQKAAKDLLKHSVEQMRASAAPKPVKVDLHKRMAMGMDKVKQKIRKDARRYSMKVNNMSLRETMKLFSRMYDLNVIVDTNVSGKVNVNFKDLPLDRAMEALLMSMDYAWEQRDGLIRVSSMATRSFTLDYIRLVRKGTGSSESGISSSGSDSTASTSTEITKEDEIAFWKELDEQLKALVSSKGRIVINRLSGTVQVTDVPSRIAEVERFVSSLSRAMHRQVEIETRIIEVSLRDDSSLGVDWSRINVPVGSGAITGGTSNLLLASAGGLQLKAATLAMEYANNRFASLIQALEEQGDVKVMSQPKIRTLNNQTAMIKVGTDLTYFTRQSVRTIVDGVSEVTESEVPTTVTEGVILSVTPQISNDRWVMLDVSPTITRITDTIVSAGGSTAPVLDVKQATALVRARDGEIIVLGGLIQEHESSTERRVPGLGAIPFAGSLFSARYDVTSRKELIIILMPRIVD